MGGLALLARAAGHRVTGCDAAVYPPMSDQLRAAGIELIDGYAADQLKLAPDLFVVGNAVVRGNPLMEAILDAGANFTSGPQWVGDQVLRHKWVLAVAGTHGKTTVSSMLAWILEHAGMAPGFLIGGVPLDFEVSARAGGSDFFVIEADEYDTAFFDKRSKFMHYFPRTVVLNNLEYDHADIFPNLDAIETQFHHLVRTLARGARIVVNGDDAALARVLDRGCWSEREYFGGTGDCQVAGAAPFAVTCRGERVGELQLAFPGAHNRSNALAAIAAAMHVGVRPQLALDALARFSGVKRRLEVRGDIDGIRVLDDFAHHPTAIKQTIAAVRCANSAGRIIAILEPRSNTMKLGAMAARLPDSLAGADRVVCFAGAGVNWDVGAALAPLGRKAIVFTELAPMVDHLVAEVRAGDQLLVMSNGAFGGIHGRLLDGLRARKPHPHPFPPLEGEGVKQRARGGPA